MLMYVKQICPCSEAPSIICTTFIKYAKLTLNRQYLLYVQEVLVLYKNGQDNTVCLFSVLTRVLSAAVRVRTAPYRTTSPSVGVPGELPEIHSGTRLTLRQGQRGVHYIVSNFSAENGIKL